LLDILSNKKILFSNKNVLDLLKAKLKETPIGYCISKNVYKIKKNSSVVHVLLVDV